MIRVNAPLPARAQRGRMSRQGDWANHAHWDHSTVAPAAPSRGYVAAWHALLRRAHLPVHPGAPVALIVLGVLHCAVVVALFAKAGGGDRALLVAAAATGALALAPGIGLIATGAWDLARGRWRRRLRRGWH